MGLKETVSSEKYILQPRAHNSILPMSVDTLPLKFSRIPLYLNGVKGFGAPGDVTVKAAAEWWTGAACSSARSFFSTLLFFTASRGAVNLVALLADISLHSHVRRSGRLDCGLRLSDAVRPYSYFEGLWFVNISKAFIPMSNHFELWSVWSGALYSLIGWFSSILFCDIPVAHKLQIWSQTSLWNS